MNYIDVKQAAEKWGVSERRVRVLCEAGKINGAFQIGRGWNIPETAAKPKDARFKDALAAAIKGIEAKKALLDAKRPLTGGELERLRDEFATEYTYNSNAIEGNTLTLRETDMVLRGVTIDKKPLKDHMEAIGHKEAFDFVLELIKDAPPLTESIIKQIHSLVLIDKPQDKGTYRHVPVRIPGAVHEPPQPFLIAPEMERLLLSYHESAENIIVKAARFHLDFEGIHPFIDGNGRTGRLLANLELMKAGYPPIDIKFEDRLRYYKAFDEYYGGGDSDAMIRLFAEYVETRLDILLKLT